MADEVDYGTLVPAAAAGDRGAAQRILAAVHPQVVRYCRLRLGADGVVSPEDVAQEISLAVIAALPRYEDRGRPFMAFVYGIASHKVADARRNGGRDLSHAVAEVPEAPDPEADPLQRVLTMDGGNEVRRLLDALGERARDIIILRVFGGYSAEETGAIVGATAGAVRVAQHRALAKMRAILEEEAEVPR